MFCVYIYVVQWKKYCNNNNRRQTNNLKTIVFFSLPSPLAFTSSECVFVYQYTVSLLKSSLLTPTVTLVDQALIVIKYCYYYYYFPISIDEICYFLFKQIYVFFPTSWSVQLRCMLKQTRKKDGIEIVLHLTCVFMCSVDLIINIQFMWNNNL